MGRGASEMSSERQVANLEREKINVSRQPELDVAKVFAIFFMIIIHVADNMGTITGTQGTVPILLDFIGGPLAAPVFMFAMGVGMVYTKHSTPGDFAKRGVHLLIVAYVLNFFRETILIIIAHVFSIETAYDKSLIDTIGTVDILHFAGMAFLIAALFKKLKADPKRVLAAALLIQAVGSLTIGMFDGLPKAMQYLLGLLFFTNNYVAFPTLLWFIYPAAGIVFASLLQRVTDKDEFYRKVTVTGLISFAAVTMGTVATNTNLLSYFMNTGYYKQNLFSSMWILSVVFMFMGLYHAISKHITGKAAAWVKTTSVQVNTIYIIQWLLITYVIGMRELAGAGYVSDAWIVPTGIIMAVISILLARVYTNISDRVRRK